MYVCVCVCVCVCKHLQIEWLSHEQKFQIPFTRERQSPDIHKSIILETKSVLN